ncbi:hypothetical protein HYH98_19295, partial [Clostridium botulinum]|nr:hypothetical protein [Clostridium botulinum]
MLKKGLLEEVKKDREMILNKERTVNGYRIINRFLELIPNNHEYLVAIDEKDESLHFSYQRIGKLSNIEDVEERDFEDDETLDRIIDITRFKGEPLSIKFIYGKDEETNDYGYIDYKIIVG